MTPTERQSLNESFAEHILGHKRCDYTQDLNAVMSPVQAWLTCSPKDRTRLCALTCDMSSRPRWLMRLIESESDGQRLTMRGPYCGTGDAPAEAVMNALLQAHYNGCF